MKRIAVLVACAAVPAVAQQVQETVLGNGWAGVVQVFTADGPERPTLDVAAMAGSFGQHRIGALFGGQDGALNFLGSASRFHTDGYREHSAADRDQANAKLRFQAA